MVLETKKIPDYEDYHKTVAVLRESAKFLENSDLLKTEGIFRISSTEAKQKKLIENILNENASMLSSNYKEVNCVIGAMKSELRRIIGAGLLPSKKVQDKFLGSLEKNKAEKSDLSAPYMEFFNDLMNGEQHEMYLAEILYIINHVAYQVTQRSAESKMDAKNCAIVIGPNILNAVYAGTPDSKYASFLPLINDSVQSTLQNDFFKESFPNHPILSSDKFIQKKCELLNECIENLEKDISTRRGLNKQINKKLEGNIERLHKLKTDIGKIKTKLNEKTKRPHEKMIKENLKQLLPKLEQEMKELMENIHPRQQKMSQIMAQETAKKEIIKPLLALSLGKLTKKTAAQSSSSSIEEKLKVKKKK